MIAVAEPRRPAGRSRWHGLTVALLSGHVVASILFFLIAAIQTPGLDPPPESVALFVVVTMAGVISYQLLRWELGFGYPAAVLTGGFVFVILALVGTGTYGPIGPRANPVGPISYAALSVTLVLSAGAAWRNGGLAETAWTAATPLERRSENG